MNIKNIISIFIGILCLFCFTTVVYSSEIEGNTKLHESISEDLLEHRLINLNSLVDIKVTPELLHIVRQYTSKQRRASEIVLGKTSTYFPLFEGVLKAENLPIELKYLSIIESGLKPEARSKVGATGLWQFMPGTGKMYGLMINSVVDQRKDPTLSTKAAAKFLKDLYRQFDNWTLALAAYNCGPGNVRKAIRKAGSKDYWVLQKYLPKETRRYIPKFIAMMYLNEYYTFHDLVPLVADLRYDNVLRSPVSKRVNFKQLSKITGLSVIDIRTINPSYIRNYIPSKGKHFINLPHESMFIYLHSIGEQDKDVYSYNGTYKMNFAVKVIEKPTKIDNTIRVINRLSILSISEVKTNIKNTVPNIESLVPYFRNKYKIRKGETILDVAMRLNIDLQDLIIWNNIELEHLPTPGSSIYLSPYK